MSNSNSEVVTLSVGRWWRQQRLGVGMQNLTCWANSSWAFLWDHWVESHYRAKTFPWSQPNCFLRLGGDLKGLPNLRTQLKLQLWARWCLISTPHPPCSYSSSNSPPTQTMLKVYHQKAMANHKNNLSEICGRNMRYVNAVPGKQCSLPYRSNCQRDRLHQGATVRHLHQWAMWPTNQLALVQAFLPQQSLAD